MALVFPNPEQTNNEGLLCYGGNLETDTLLQAYSMGIFPWYDKFSPILWWSPPIRMILKPDLFKPSKSLNSLIRKNIFEIKFDNDFETVIALCASTKRKGQKGTWITPEMIEAYIKLHNLGYAHSVEAWNNGKISGGLYGVSLGRAFFGESMFHLESNASKVAFYHLVKRLISWHFHFIDAQQNTDHLKSLGAYSVERKEFLNLLHKALQFKTIKGKWS